MVSGYYLGSDVGIKLQVLRPKDVELICCSSR